MPAAAAGRGVSNPKKPKHSVIRPKPKFFNKSDFIGYGVPKRENGFGKKIFEGLEYSSLAPTLLATENGYTVHPDAEKQKLFRPERGARPPTLKLSSYCFGRC